MTADYYTQHMQCTREEKLDCLPVVRELVMLAYTVRDEGLLKLDALMRDKLHFHDKFLRRAASLVVETANVDNIEEVLYNLVFNSSDMSNSRFFRSILIAETMVAIGRGEDMDYIFAYLVPSFFGLEYVDQVEELYYQCKHEYLTRRAGEKRDKKF